MSKAINIGVVITVLAVVAAYFVFNTTEASTFPGTEYKASSIVDATTGTSSIKRAYGSIGSIVVTDSSSAAGVIGFYDTASTTIATTSATSILNFDGVAAEGTYQFDVGFNEGLMIDVPTAFDGTVIVTYR